MDMEKEEKTKNSENLSDEKNLVSEDCSSEPKHEPLVVGNVKVWNVEDSDD